MSVPVRIVVASTHARHDALESALRKHSDLEVHRVREPAGLTQAELRRIDPAWVFLPHWSHRVPREIYEPFECVVFHMTDVPFGRGGSPLQNLVMLGHDQTKLAAMRCVEELDAGPVYLKRDLSTLGTAEEVLVRAAMLMEGMILEIVRCRPQPMPQAGEVVRFERRRPEQGNLSLASSLSQAHDMIRMLDGDGYPHAFLQVGELRLEFSRSSRRADHLSADVRITWSAEPPSSP